MRSPAEAAARDDPVLDDPVRAALRGPHAHLSRQHGRAVRYVPEVATFVSVPPDASPDDWSDLAALLGPGGFADLFSSPVTPPEDWPPVFSVTGVQLVGCGDEAAVEAELEAGAAGSSVVELGSADVPEMLELAGRTSPGPFWSRTIELGGYLGVREQGRLVAMTGERLRPPGWTEISAVCTAPEARGRGLATRLVRAAAARISARGERPFLHVIESNTAALALYERLGFGVRRRVTFHGFRTPG